MLIYFVCVCGVCTCGWVCLPRHDCEGQCQSPYYSLLRQGSSLNLVLADSIGLAGWRAPGTLVSTSSLLALGCAQPCMAFLCGCKHLIQVLILAQQALNPLSGPSLWPLMFTLRKVIWQDIFMNVCNPKIWKSDGRIQKPKACLDYNETLFQGKGKRNDVKNRKKEKSNFSTSAKRTCGVVIQLSNRAFLGISRQRFNSQQHKIKTHIYGYG